MRRPHAPEICEGLSDNLWSLATPRLTGRSSGSHDAEQYCRPQRPMPSNLLASSRTPICLSSMRVRKMAVGANALHRLAAGIFVEAVQVLRQSAILLGGETQCFALGKGGATSVGAAAIPLRRQIAKRVDVAEILSTI